MAKTRPGWELRAFIACLAFILLLGQANAHSGVERLMRVATNGTLVGKEGYPRGFIPRNSPAFQDEYYTYLIPPNGRAKIIQDDDKIAHPQQRVSNYTEPFKPLTAAPGDLIALQYQENGHTTLPGNQPNKTLNRGTVYIYGTPELSSDANLLDIHYKWNTAGTGGDGKGILLATRNFDDGRCYQINGQAISQDRQAKFPKKAEPPMDNVLWCQNDVALPPNLSVGKPYTLIWVWDWPTMDRANVPYPPSSAPGAAPGVDGALVKIPELYTTVMDINIVDPCDKALGEVKSPLCSNGGQKQTFTVKETDLNVAAVPDQVTNMFLVNVSALFGSGTSNPSSDSSSSDSGSSKTTTADASKTTTADASKPTKTTGGGRIRTTTVYESLTTTTITVQPSAATSSPGKKVKTTTATVMAATTKTVTTPVSPGTAAASDSTATTPLTTTLSPQTGAAWPTVSSFLKDARDLSSDAKNRRREAGQWGFGHAHHHA